MVAGAMKHAAAKRRPVDLHSFFTHSWLADDLALADGASVASWPSGSVPATMTEATNRPTYGATSGPGSQPEVVFDTTNDNLAVTFAAEYLTPNSMVLVGRTTGGGTSRDLFDGSSGVGRHLLRSGATGTTWQMFQGSAVQGFTGAPAADTNTHLFVIHYNNASSQLELDGVPYTVAGAPGTTGCLGIRLNANQGLANFAGLRCSFVGFYDDGDVRTHPDWAHFEAAVTAKWGLSIA